MTCLKEFVGFDLFGECVNIDQFFDSEEHLKKVIDKLKARPFAYVITKIQFDCRKNILHKPNQTKPNQF